MNPVRHYIFCKICSHELISDTRYKYCPRCRADDVFRSRMLICSCGERVELRFETNECFKCGNAYLINGEQVKESVTASS